LVQIAPFQRNLIIFHFSTDAYHFVCAAFIKLNSDKHREAEQNAVGFFHTARVERVVWVKTKPYIARISLIRLFFLSKRLPKSFFRTRCDFSSRFFFLLPFSFALKKHFLSGIAQSLWSEILSPCFLSTSGNATEFKDFFGEGQRLARRHQNTRVAPERKVIEVDSVSPPSHPRMPERFENSFNLKLCLLSDVSVNLFKTL
jgi:hypothetical protein